MQAAEWIMFTGALILELHLLCGVNIRISGKTLKNYSISDMSIVLRFNKHFDVNMFTPIIKIFMTWRCILFLSLWDNYERCDIEVFIWGRKSSIDLQRTIALKRLLSLKIS